MQVSARRTQQKIKDNWSSWAQHTKRCKITVNQHYNKCQLLDACFPGFQAGYVLSLADKIAIIIEAAAVIAIWHNRRRLTIDVDSDVGRIGAEAGDGGHTARSGAVVGRRDGESVGPEDGLVNHETETARPV